MLCQMYVLEVSVLYRYKWGFIWLNGVSEGSLWYPGIWECWIHDFKRRGKITMMKKLAASVVLMKVCLVGMAQVGVGTTTPEAALDVSSGDSGFLFPRVLNTAAVTAPVEGMIIYDVSSKCFRGYQDGGWTFCGLVSVARLATLDCAGAEHSGGMAEGEPANTVSTSVPYTGGNEGYYEAISFTSTGVTGLTASLPAGELAKGSGSLNFSITGTPNSTGTATFFIDVGGQSCSFSRTVMPPLVAGEVISPTGRIWMDRNLGASQVASSGTDAAAYGDLYQWGRGADGHQSRTSITTPTLATSSTPGHGDFIRGGTTDYDWLTSQDDTLWQGVSGTNNPCPSGYRIPTKTEWDAEFETWSSKNVAGAYASVLKLPAAGQRLRGGGLDDVGSQGHYASSTVNGAQVYILYATSTTASTSSIHRNKGFSVRCIKD